MLMKEMSDDAQNSTLGDIFAVFANLFGAMQATYEEKYIKKYNIKPLNVVGLKGTFSLIILSFMLVGFYYLKIPFEMVLRRGYKKDDKCLRNEICVLLNYVVSSPESHGFFLQPDNSESEETILEQMTVYAVYDEINGDQNQPLFQVTEEDLELKKLLWTQIFAVCQDPFNTEAHNIIT